MVKIWVVLFTVVLIIFTTLYIIGLRAMANEEPRLEGYGPEDAEQAEVGGPNFEPSIITHFLEAAVSGVMPGGLKTTQPLFPKEYIHHFGTKYADWAPPPYDQLPPPPMEAIGPMPGESPPPIVRVMHVVSGMDRMFSMALNKQLTNLEPSFKAIRTKLWFGMPPMSEARWAAKGLDEEDNIEEAIAIIQQAIDVFKYNLKLDVQGEMRTTHNKVWTEIDVFHDAIVALRAQNEEEAPDFNIAKLWQEYIMCHFQYVENQARAWAFKRLKTLYQVWKGRLMRVMQSGQTNGTESTIRIDHWALMIMDKLLDLYGDAEIFLRCRIDGYAMINGIEDYRLRGAITLEKTEKELNAIYAEIENKRVADLKGMLGSVQAARTAARRMQPGQLPEFMEKTSLLVDREFAMRSLMKHMDNPLGLGVESWIQKLADEKVERFGFVVYRNTYGQSEDEWKMFMEKFEVGLNSGWDGVLDPENVKRKATLHWIDGKEEGIPEDDVEAIRKHFNSFTKYPSFPSDLTENTCLAITLSSCQSFIQPNQKGDYRGFLVAIDSTYVPAKSAERKGGKDNSTFAGHFNIIDQLLWTDLYALKEKCIGQNAQDYWRLAAQHPWGVYVGPTTGVLRRKWRIMGEGGKRSAETLEEL